MPARKAPSTSESPATPVRKARSSVTSSTLSTKSSVERRRATTPSQARISFGPAITTSASASAAFASAVASATPSSPAGRPSAGSSTRSGTTARSWKSSTPMTWRPCGLSSSPRSAKSFETIAVEDIAATAPSANPACHDAPSARARPMAISVLTATCEKPSPNTVRRIAISLGRLNSRPIENIRNTTPNSASRCVSS